MTRRKPYKTTAARARDRESDKGDIVSLHPTKGFRTINRNSFDAAAAANHMRRAGAKGSHR